MPLLWSILPRYKAIWLKFGVEIVLALFSSCALNFEDELLSIWKWFLFLRLESWKVPQMLYCFHVCLCFFKTKMEIMIVCYNIIIFKTLSSLLFIFSSSQKIFYSRRLVLEIVTVFFWFCVIHCIRETYGNICLNF